MRYDGMEHDSLPLIDELLPAFGHVCRGVEACEERLEGLIRNRRSKNGAATCTYHGGQDNTTDS